MSPAGRLPAAPHVCRQYPPVLAGGAGWCTRTRSWLYSTQRVRVDPSPLPPLHPFAPHMSVNRLQLGLVVLADVESLGKQTWIRCLNWSSSSQKSKRRVFSCQVPRLESRRPFRKYARGDRGEGREVQGSLGVFALWLLRRGLSLPEGCYGNSI